MAINAAWLVTDECIPYLAFSGHLAEGLTAEAAVERLGREFHRVENIYNVIAFSLNEACTEVFVVGLHDSSAALIALRNDPIPCEHDDSPTAELQDAISCHLEKINQVLRLDRSTRAFKIESWRLEVSRRNA